MRNYLERLRVFHFNDTSINARIRSTSNIFDAAYLRSDAGNIAAFLYRMRESQENVPYYERIVRHIRMVLPQFFDFVLEPNENGYLSLNWKQEGAEEVFGPHQFSDGALRFAALTTLLLQPTSTAPMTIILDEPEIGLHPYAVSLLSKEIQMASKTSQIIVSTQSPLLLNEFSCEDIITAEYDGIHRKSILRRHKKADLQEWLEDYTLGELWEKMCWEGCRYDTCKCCSGRQSEMGFAKKLLNVYFKGSPSVNSRCVLTSRNRKMKSVHILEEALKADIVSGMDLKNLSQRFIPYIQLHEFEALLFTDITVLKKDYLEREDMVRIGKLYEDTKDIPPEEINHGEETAASGCKL
ncbi:MAG: DUF4276 family protein [Eubacterium sp.]|nr:DUF4276 family protein [Eubacterium sp.]